MKKYLLEFTVFICGAVVMVFELVGSRILAPYLGTSIFVWTSLIGVILGSLSGGYWWGGKMADKNPRWEMFSFIILVSSLAIGFVAFIKTGFLILLSLLVTNLKWGSIIASLVLFALPSWFLGAVSPYAVKLKITNLNLAAGTVGNLYAISTLGSIFGTFVGGFFLVPLLGVTKILFLLSLLLFITAVLIYPKNLFKNILGLKLFSCFLVFLLLFCSWSVALSAVAGLVNIETQYNSVQIYNGLDHNTQQPIKTMAINSETNSAMFLNSDDLVYEYTKYYRLAKHFKPDLKNGLMIGGGGYSYPKDFLKNFPDAKLDVVEIDPGLTELAQKYFNLKLDPRLTIYHQDARTYLNKNNKKYDAVFGDAFKSFYSIPYQLTTKEAVEKIYQALNDDGVVILNVISALSGPQARFLQAEYLTYKSVFPKVYIFPVRTLTDQSAFQNIVLIALKSEKEPALVSDDLELNSYLSHLWQSPQIDAMPILTDDYAPVDYYLGAGLIF